MAQTVGTSESKTTRCERRTKGCQTAARSAASFFGRYRFSVSLPRVFSRSLSLSTVSPPPLFLSSSLHLSIPRSLLGFLSSLVSLRRALTFSSCPCCSPLSLRSVLPWRSHVIPPHLPAHRRTWPHKRQRVLHYGLLLMACGRFFFDSRAGDWFVFPLVSVFF